MIRCEILKDHAEVCMSGELHIICSELEALISNFYRENVKHLGEDEANRILARIGRCAVMDDDEREAEFIRTMEERICQDN